MAPVPGAGRQLTARRLRPDWAGFACWKPAAASADRPRMSLALQSCLPFPNSCQGTSPHQQGRGTKMTEHYYCGIDVAKDRLDVQVLPHRQRFSVDNNATG